MRDSLHILSEKVVFECPYFQILDRYCEFPDGSRHHFYIRNETDTCCVLAMTKDGGFIAEKQFRLGAGKELYQLPAGCLESFSDNPDDRIREELLEETGYVGQFKKVGEMPTSPYSTRKIHCYYATDCIKISEQNLEQTELIEVEIVSQEQMRELLMSGSSSSCVPGLLAWEWLQKDGYL